MSKGGYPEYPLPYSYQSPPTMPQQGPIPPPYGNGSQQQYPPPPAAYYQQPPQSPPPAYSPPEQMPPPNSNNVNYQAFSVVTTNNPNQQFGAVYSYPQPSAPQGWTNNNNQQPCEGVGNLYPQLPPAVPPPPQGYTPAVPPSPQGYTPAVPPSPQGYNSSVAGPYEARPTPPVPQRPAPPPPQPSLGQTSIGFGQTDAPLDYGYQTGAISNNPGFQDSANVSQKQNWQDTPLPQFTRESWQCGADTKVYLQQHDGVISAPTQHTLLKVYVNPDFDFSHCPSRRTSLTNSRNNSARNSPTRDVGGSSANLQHRGSIQFAGIELPSQQFSVLIECPGICRVKLSPTRGHVLLTSARDFMAMVDQGTKPSRCVVLSLPKELDEHYMQQLLALLEENATLSVENDGVLTTVTSTIESAFNVSSKFSSDLIKGSLPGLHKSTHGLRRTTGALVRLGGNLVNKGTSFVVDKVAPTDKEEKMQQYDPMVNRLKAAIAAVREGLVNGSIHYVTGPRSL